MKNIIITAIITSSIYLVLFLYINIENNSQEVKNNVEANVLEAITQTERNCTKDGTVLYEALIGKVKSEPGDSVYGEKYKIKYNKFIGRCFLSYEYGYGEVFAKYIVDVYTREKVSSYFKNGNFIDGENDYNKNYSKYMD